MGSWPWPGRYPSRSSASTDTSVYGYRGGHGFAGAPRTLGGLGAISGPPFSIGQGDVHLTLRHLALDAAPDRRRRERRAVALRAALQLVEQRARLLQASARRLGRAADVVVAGAGGLVPGLLEVGHQQHHPVDLAVEVRRPFLRRGEARAVGAHDPVEVRGELRDLLEVMLHSRARLLEGTLVVRPGGDDREEEPDGGEHASHRLQYNERAAITSGPRAPVSARRRQAGPRATARPRIAAPEGPRGRRSDRSRHDRSAGHRRAAW